VGFTILGENDASLMRVSKKLSAFSRQLSAKKQGLIRFIRDTMVSHQVFADS
jgi:hypothetical protein